MRKRLERYRRRLVKGIRERKRRIVKRVKHRLAEALGEGLYPVLIRCLRVCPLPLPSARGGKAADSAKRVAYFLWRFPVLSETFIQREVTGLRGSRLPVEVFAYGADTVDRLDGPAHALIAGTHYLDEPGSPWSVGMWGMIRRRPGRCFRLFLFVMTHRYTAHKSFREDKSLFGQALHLAERVTALGLNHIHAAWADRCAFVALVASRLLDIPYTVQIRAHELHRHDAVFALPEKLENAKWIVTNSRFNEAHLKRLLSPGQSARVFTNYNGLDLERFQPPESRAVPSGGVNILSVARLIETKGLDNLLRSCAELKASGRRFHCDIVGGTEEPRSTVHYIRLRKMWRALGLENDVTFRGAIPFAEVLLLYRAAHIFALPLVISPDGAQDITPNSLLEAMAMQLPVICTPITAIPEIVENEASGLLIAPGDVPALTAALIRLIEDPGLRERLGRQARRRIEERFNRDRNIHRLASLLAPQIQKQTT